MINVMKIRRDAHIEEGRHLQIKIVQKTLTGKAYGSFTVEAALLMAIIIPVLVSLIYAGFYLHDHAVLQGASCEITAMGSNLQKEDKINNRLEKLKKELCTSRLLGTTGVSSTLEIGENQVSVSYRGTFPIPGLIARLFSGGSLNVEKSWSRKIFHPADTIRKIRGLKYLIQSVRG